MVPHLLREAATVDMAAASIASDGAAWWYEFMDDSFVMRVRDKQFGRRRIALVTTVALGVKCVAE